MAELRLASEEQTGWGAVLVMVPRLALLGVGLLAVTMAGAVGIVAVVLHRPADSFVPGVLLVGVVGVGLWWWKGR